MELKQLEKEELLVKEVKELLNKLLKFSVEFEVYTDGMLVYHLDLEDGLNGYEFTIITDQQLFKSETLDRFLDTKNKYFNLSEFKNGSRIRNINIK